MSGVEDVVKVEEQGTPRARSMEARVIDAPPRALTVCMCKHSSMIKRVDHLHPDALQDL